MSPELLELLKDCWDYFDNKADAEQPYPDSGVRMNKEMELRNRIERAMVNGVDFKHVVGGR